MKIDLTRKEYRTLLDMVYIAEWIINAHRVDSDPRTEPYGALQQKVFALAKQMKYENLIEYDAEVDTYYPTGEYEESGAAHDFIDEYEDESFWSELIVRLAQRDLIQQVGSAAKVSTLPFEERLIRLADLENTYAMEFEKYGLARIMVRNRKPPRNLGKGVH